MNKNGTNDSYRSTKRFCDYDWDCDSSRQMRLWIHSVTIILLIIIFSFVCLASSECVGSGANVIDDTSRNTRMDEYVFSNPTDFSISDGNPYAGATSIITVNESIIIGESIEVKITDIQGDSVKIGITAPKDVSIFREELYRQIKDHNIQSAGLKDQDIDDLENLLTDK